MQRTKQEKSRQNESPASPGTSSTFCRAPARCYDYSYAYADATAQPVSPIQIASSYLLVICVICEKLFFSYLHHLCCHHLNGRIRFILLRYCRPTAFFVSLIVTLPVMNSTQNLVKNLNPQYFWDVDLLKLNDIKGKRLIIERVTTLGSVKEIFLIFERYGRDEIIKTICNINYLDPKTLNFFSKLLNLPKKNFRCYTRRQLKPQHWNS
jgi:hypothetical protein